MKIFSREKNETRANVESPTVPISSENILSFLGIDDVSLPNVSIDSALTVPAVLAAVSFLSRSLASLPLHAYQRDGENADRVSGRLQTMIHENPNPGMDSFKFRQYFWQQVFTGGRGLAYIDRNKRGEAIALWPIDATKVKIRRRKWELFYTVDKTEYAATDVIDVPFMLKDNMTGHYGPIGRAKRAIQSAIAMNDYASKYFANGGVPPLSLEGPLPEGDTAMKRALGQIKRAIQSARDNGSSIFGLPPGYTLKPVAFEPDKSQMIDARKFQITEFARVFQLPPAFLQDLEHGTFSNTEQQDLHLVKHLIGQWVVALEGELNLKLFGPTNGRKFVRHNLDGLLRGDFKSRIEAMAIGIHSSQLMPNEARKLEKRPPGVGGDALYIQSATVPLTAQTDFANGENSNDN